MLDSFSAQLGSPDNSSSPSGIHHRQDSSYNSLLDYSPLSNPAPSASEHQRGGPVGGGDMRAPAQRYDQNSSLDTPAAAAGSLLPSSNPPGAIPITPNRQNQQLNVNQRDGIPPGSSPGDDSELAYRRGGDDSDESDGSGHGKTISAGAFKRMKGGGLPPHPAVGRMPREGAPGSGSYPQQYQQPPNSANIPPSDMTPRMRSVSPPTQMGRYPSEMSSVYQTPQQTPPAGIPNDMTALPPGAAAPRMGGAPSPQGSPRWSAAQANQLQGRQSPSPSLKSDRIPSSLLPGRPGSASPLAPIGHTQMLPSLSSPGGAGRGMYYGGGPNMGPGNGYGPPSASSQGYGAAPWQQPQYGQQQQRGPTPLLGEFDGTRGMQAAYGGPSNDSPYGAAGSGRGGYGGPGGYGGNRQGY
jgi:hypothetical protein